MANQCKKNKTVLVIGAGIAGLAAAWALNQKGFAVRVIDASSDVAQGASFANGAQLSYSYVQPLADPGVWRQLPSLLFSASSPFAWRPSWSGAQWQWLLLFALASRRKVSIQTTLHLLALGRISREVLENMLATTGIDCLYAQTGKLVVYPTLTSLRAAQRQVALQAQLGCEQHLLSASEAIKVEPAIRDYGDQMAGAVYTPNECVADCLLLCQRLRVWLIRQGVLFDMERDVVRLSLSEGRVVGAETSLGCLKADHYVLSAGTRSRALVASCLPMRGFRVPVYPLKGYSLTLNLDGCANAAPRVSVTDTSRKLVFARLGDQLRVAGFAEIRDHDTKLDGRRIEQMLEAVQALFPRLSLDGHTAPWFGHRPATPTGRPLVGRLPGGPRNLWMHTGHGMLGLTLAFGTAEQLAQQMEA